MTRRASLCEVQVQPQQSITKKKKKSELLKHSREVHVHGHCPQSMAIGLDVALFLSNGLLILERPRTTAEAFWSGLEICTARVNMEKDKGEH